MAVSTRIKVDNMAFGGFSIGTATE